jgi:hypothetical protein
MVYLGDPNCLNYLRNISISENDHFFLPWGGCVLRDCSQNGDLLTFKSVNDYKERKQLGEHQWLFLALHLFIDQVSGTVYAV